MLAISSSKYWGTDSFFDGDEKLLQAKKRECSSKYKLLNMKLSF
jgi:hypothetical protein